MTLEAFYFIAQIVGGLAVIGSLIFVGLEVRQKRNFSTPHIINTGSAR